MFDVIEQIINNAPDYVHVEARFHQRENIEVKVENGQLKHLLIDDYSGVGIRVLVNGAYGLAATSTLTKQAVKKALKQAISVANSLSQNTREKIHLAPIEPVIGKYQSSGNDPIKNHSDEELVKLALEIDKEISIQNEQIKGTSIEIRYPTTNRIIMNSDGTKVEITDTIPDFSYQAIASENGEIMPFKTIGGICGGYEMFEKYPPLELAKTTAKKAVEFLNAPLAKGGLQTVVMEPAVVGFLCHELVGHNVESDFVMSGSVMKDQIGKQIASEMVTMIDSGEQVDACGWLPVDDAGVKAEPTTIIKDGILKSFLHSRATAHLFNVTPTGNDRAYEYDNEPLIRMRNTYLELGDFSIEELLEEIEIGYLLVQPGGGQADSTAEFMFSVIEAYEIRKGEIKQPVKNITLTGNAFAVLQNIDALGKNWELNSGYDFCYKWQPMKVDGGGPSARTRIIVSGENGGR